MTLEQLQDRCYTPYSNNTDVVIVESARGNLYPGIRIENISFPLTISSVQCGLSVCVSEGEQPSVLYLPDSRPNENHLEFWKQELDLDIKYGSKFVGEPTNILQPTDDIEEQLESLLEHSKVPHSHFPVSALLETDQGMVAGVNIEFSAWETGLCAERIAIAKALAYGISSSEIKAMHLHTRYGEFSSPCGACRQVIIEHLPHIPVFIHHADGTVSRHFSSDLLPYSFKSDFLKTTNKSSNN